MAKLLDVGTAATLTREEAAQRLRTIADQLERHNSLEFVRDGQRFTVEVADQVHLEVELEIEGDKSELEIEISW
jgi:amphi-Trp domain-containing protein